MFNFSKILGGIRAEKYKKDINNSSLTQISVSNNSSSNYARQLSSALMKAMSGYCEIAPELLDLEGMSGKKYRMFINNLIRDLDKPKYLEVGSWKGSTLCSAINKNALQGTAIDNWSEFGGPKDEFIQNYNKFKNENVDINIIESDFRAVNYRELGRHNVYLFDGPHSLEDQYDGLKLALDALVDEFIFIVDDWNWVQVREGTFRAILDVPVELVYSVEIRTSLDNSHGFPPAQLGDWHNGYFLSVLKKK